MNIAQLVKPFLYMWLGKYPIYATVGTTRNKQGGLRLISNGNIAYKYSKRSRGGRGQ